MTGEVGFSQWLSRAVRVAVPELRAADAWNRITENPTTVLFRAENAGSGYTLDPQSVRVEFDSMVLDEGESESGSGYYRRVVIFGVKDHPSVPRTDVKRGYRFVYMGHEFFVCDVVERMGEIQAYAEMVQ